MPATKLVTVYGATGAQGGSVVRSLLRDQSGIFKVRAISRNPESEGARALAAAGAELIKADGFKKEELLSAFAGSWGVFVNTNSDDPAVGQKNGPSETDIGKDVVEAAVEVGVKHFVYSGLASASLITKGEIPVECFDEKHAIAEYARSKASFSSVVVVSPGWYMENFLDKDVASLFGGLPYFPDEDGYLTLNWPHWGGNDQVPLAAIGADFGDYVHGVFLQPERYNGMFIQGFSQPRSLGDIAKDVQEVTGKKARFVPIEDWRSIETNDDRFLVTVRGMFGLCQHSGGCYYGTPNSTEAAFRLKQAAITAQGGNMDNVKLLTLREFSQKHLSE
ncbi:hypothetical protein BGZ61DRAFT_498513 [Ilyonectria robusta]|uniref:uncharacterized protein n=1 Tax=Ilyonectria robusta TaxID=1079257 RepID=UPI001E8D7F32|nr:uncharacterized protein BGZ61DRAFT_498513 [Ilyonectria robusta]KAH8666064.1 hypothetical protein BGZ61DRAFT_498513 [Ilyonectria robusta]